MVNNTLELTGLERDESHLWVDFFYHYTILGKSISILIYSFYKILNRMRRAIK